MGRKKPSKPPNVDVRKKAQTWSKNTRRRQRRSVLRGLGLPKGMPIYLSGIKPRHSEPCDCYPNFSHVKETRMTAKGTVRRRIQCDFCGHRWTTYNISPGRVA